MEGRQLFLSNGGVGDSMCKSVHTNFWEIPNTNLSMPGKMAPAGQYDGDTTANGRGKDWSAPVELATVETVPGESAPRQDCVRRGSLDLWFGLKNRRA